MLARLGALVGAKLGFDSAETGGRHASWEVGGSSSNDDHHRSQGARLRARSRDLARNDLVAPTVLRKLSLAMSGLTPRANTGDPTLDADVNALWDESSREMSSSSYHSINGVQHQALTAWLRDGAALVRGRLRQERDGLTVPFQVEAIPIEHLITEDTRSLSNGGRVVQGVELDSIGRLTAFHLWTERPGSQWFTGQRVRVPESSMCHLYHAEEIGQQRGVPWLSPAMAAVRDLQLLGDAVRTRAVGEASAMAFVTSSSGLDESVYGGVDKDAKGRLIEEFVPGSIGYLQPGQDVKFHTPTGTSFEATRRQELQQIAAAAGITYEQLTGDLSRTNWTSYKAGQIDHRALVRWAQRELVIPIVMRRIWVWWVDAAIFAGILPEAVRSRVRRVTGGGAFRMAYPVRWVLPRFEEVDREAEAKATKELIRCGLTTYEEELERSGLVPDDVYESMSRTVEALRARQIVLDSIPATSTSSGQAQTPAQPAPDVPRNARP